MVHDTTAETGKFKVTTEERGLLFASSWRAEGSPVFVFLFFIVCFVIYILCIHPGDIDVKVKGVHRGRHVSWLKPLQC